MHQRGEHSAALEAYRNAIDAAMPRFRAFGGDPVLLGGRTGMLKRGVGAVLSDQGHSHQAMEVFGESVADLRSALVDAAHLAPESRRWLVEALQTSLLSLAAEASKALLVDRSATAFREAIDVVAQDPKPSLTLLRRAAQACERSAELSDVTGDRRAVLSDRERCARLRRDVVAQADSPASRLALANAEFEVAGALCALGRSDDATAPLRRAESIAEGVAGVADVSDAAKDLLARIDFAIRDIDGRHGS